VILKHSYKAVYRIGGYASNLDYDTSLNTYPIPTT
ncbi:hypothetical protein EZS27_036767, partial [termite gut metagenome]